MNENFDNLKNSSSNEILHKILIKENEALKRFNKDKINSNDTLSTLLIVLEMQRERISILEEENERLFKVNQKLENQSKEKDMKILSRSFLMDDKKEIKTPMSNTNYTGNNFYNNEFDINAIKSFGSFSVFNKEKIYNNEDKRYKTPTNNKDFQSQFEFYKKKCQVLESNIQELNEKYQKEVINLKSKIIENNSNNNYNTGNYTSMNSSINLQTPQSNKKILTPISKLTSSYNKNNSNNNYKFY